MVRQIFGSKAKKPDPRFIDIQGFRASRPRVMADYFLCSSSLVAIACAGVVMGGYATFGVVDGTALSIIFSNVVGGAVGAVTCLGHEHEILRRLPVLKASSIDREGRYPPPKNLPRLLQDMAIFKSHVSLNLKKATFGIGLGVCISAVYMSANMPLTAALTVFASSALVPFFMRSLNAAYRIRAIERKQYTFCADSAVPRESKVDLTYHAAGALARTPGAVAKPVLVKARANTRTPKV